MEARPLKYYQSQAVEYALKNKYCILALEPGLGKTRIAIEIRKKRDNNCLVICPSYLILNWVKEIKLWEADAQITTFRSGKEIYEPCDSDYVITSYDLIQKADHLFEWADMVVCDECHNLKSMKSRRSQFIHKNVYENSVDSLYLLTGTPIKNRTAEFYSLISLCFYNPNTPQGRFLEQYPDEISFADHFSYREQYTIEISGRYVTIVKWHGLKNVKELRKHLNGKYFRVKSADVLDLPPLTYKSFHVSDDDDLELLTAFHSYFEEDDDNRYKERSERTGSVLPEHKAAAAMKKVPFTIKYATDLLEEVECLLIYSDHVAPAEEIAKAFGVHAITGKVPSTKRSNMADKFQAGEGRVLVATIGSMKEGKDLYRASHIIFNDQTWVPGDMQQVVYRIQRIGQRHPCTIHRIVGSPQDEAIMRVIDEKIDTINRAT